MPHKVNAACRHLIPRPKRRVTNWSDYNEALRQRGSLAVWFTDEAITAWKAAPRTTPGGQPHYQRQQSLPVAAANRSEEVLHDLDVLLDTHGNFSISHGSDRARSGPCILALPVGTSCSSVELD
jgi:hypothetical protein